METILKTTFCAKLKSQLQNIISEYSTQEVLDASKVIDWIISQSWQIVSFIE
jgi:hypothetical protein